MDVLKSKSEKVVRNHSFLFVSILFIYSSLLVLVARINKRSLFILASKLFLFYLYNTLENIVCILLSHLLSFFLAKLTLK